MWEEVLKEEKVLPFDYLYSKSFHWEDFLHSCHNVYHEYPLVAQTQDLKCKLGKYFFIYYNLNRHMYAYKFLCFPST